MTLFSCLRAREVTLYDSADADADSVAGPEQASDRRTLLAATLVPAVLAAIAGALLAPAFGGGGSPGFGPDTAAARALAQEAARPAGESALPRLVPVVDRDGRPQLGEQRPERPFWISIPSAGVESPVDAVGATDAGLTLPGRGRTGWWDGGPRPGEDGRAVIVGHLDTRKGPDVFANAPLLEKGDRIMVRDHAGATHRYSVVGVTRVKKAEFPTGDVYGRAPRPVLVLVTCGGPYEPALGHYRDNVLVYARAL